MSLKTWKKEFYPKKAVARKSYLTAAKNCLRKWEGALQKNLKRHKVELGYGDITDVTNESSFEFATHNCELCLTVPQFGAGDEIYEETGQICDCSFCPITKVRGASCCVPLDNMDDDPWFTFNDENRPYPMIRLLRKTVKYLENKET
jgi:hypothetical protein